jgi:hypothetical protein
MLFPRLCTINQLYIPNRSRQMSSNLIPGRAFGHREIDSKEVLTLSPTATFMVPIK